MRNVDLLVYSLSYIESHLTEDIKTMDIAKACFCSKSTLERLFQRINKISVRGYIIRRRMMLSAREIATLPDKSILEIAVKYGYSTHESFTRAFKEVWNCTPSEFRGKKYAELYPRLTPPIEEGEPFYMQKKHVDISELYDLFIARRDCYFICADIKCLIPINNISHKAGDLAIIESLNRLNNVCSDEDIAFRIGGDEFCILTNSPDEAYADKLVEEIKSHNGETFDYNGQSIPLSLYVVTTRFDGSQLKYDELFKDLHLALNDAKGL